jgi:hypothetical protein
MRRADSAFVAYLAVLVLAVGFMAVNTVAASRSASLAALASDQVPNRLTDRSAGPVPPSRVAGAFDWR